MSRGRKNISDHGVLIADANSYLPDPGCGNYLAVITIHSYIINSKDSGKQSDVPGVSPMPMEGDAIRLIHAREATRREREAYEEG